MRKARLLRERQRWSLRDAEALIQERYGVRVGYSSIHAFENGDRFLKLAALQAYAKLLNCSLDDLVAEVEPEPAGTVGE